MFKSTYVMMIVGGLSLGGLAALALDEWGSQAPQLESVAIVGASSLEASTSVVTTASLATTTTVDTEDPSTWDSDADLATIRLAFSDVRNGFQTDPDDGWLMLADTGIPSISPSALADCWGMDGVEEAFFDIRVSNLVPNPGWTIPELPEYSLDGWRVYLGDWEITWGDGSGLYEEPSGVAHVATRSGGDVAWFPNCPDNGGESP